MDKKWIEICKEIFEEENKNAVDAETKTRYHQRTGMEISEEYQYILEHYADVYVKEQYGFKAIETSTFAGDDGFDIFSDFIGLSGRDNFFKIYDMYEEQLPRGVYPLANIDGGNLLCIEAVTGKIYVWIHDNPEGEDLFLAAKSLVDLLERMEIMPEQDIDISGIVSVELSEDFFELLEKTREES